MSRAGARVEHNSLIEFHCQKGVSAEITIMMMINCVMFQPMNDVNMMIPITMIIMMVMVITMIIIMIMMTIITMTITVTLTILIQAASVHPVQCKAGRLVPKFPTCVVHQQV